LKGGPDAEEIRKNIKEGNYNSYTGTLVHSDLIVRLLKKAIALNGTRRYLIDGFPRNKENMDSFHRIVGNEVDVRSLIYFECSE
jgi:adenylate kinase family enzyme